MRSQGGLFHVLSSKRLRPMKRWSQESYNKLCKSMFLKQKKFLMYRRLMHRAASPMGKSFKAQTHTNESDNLLLHRYSWPNRHMKQVPGEQHSSNHRSVNGLCLHKLLWGDDPGQKINTIPLLTHFSPLSDTQETKNKARKLVDQIKTAQQVKERGDTPPPKQQEIQSHSLPPTSVDTLQAITTMENTHTSPHPPSSTPSFYCQVSSHSCILSQPLPHLLPYWIWEDTKTLCCASTLQQ